MSSPLLVMLALALLLTGAGLWSWEWARRRHEQLTVGRNLDRRFASEAGARRPQEDDAALNERLADPSGRPDRWRPRRPVMPAWLLGVIGLRGLCLLGLLQLVVMLLAAELAGVLAAVVALLLGLLLSVFLVWLGIQKRRQVLVRQLPGFLDSMVRLITIGHSTHAAFQISVQSAKLPLRAYLDHVGSLLKAGVELEPALLQVARSVRIDELHLLASVLGLSVRYGGRADVLLERMAHFMRDGEQAERELVAMSAETRMSAWLLSLLPLLVGGAIIMLNAAYFTLMWRDETGQMLLMCGAGLQLLGIFLLYRLARLV